MPQATERLYNSDAKKNHRSSRFGKLHDLARTCIASSAIFTRRKSLAMLPPPPFQDKFNGSASPLMRLLPVEIRVYWLREAEAGA
ncbi:uncharacterized protein TRIREDRAFT_106583 [Trichoderma reesei QM6a]|uniref:Predicted protein n=2 Tax=Hypocrea jecorina TaxID=51453 RepID=G0RGT9_HYPJQ|nr:uncharacterized protein TRIREDRAFT_106583 [Trichoderma reesei QM6a]EGR49634.1 predicted protein [Trichoderma reesei QM6a]ETS02823.1 hypothetical protein M419DRAFT_76279 [Trichoderma reesei RUT C-30]